MSEIRLSPTKILQEAVERVGPVFLPVALLTLPGILIPYGFPPFVAAGINVVYVLLIAPILGGASIILISRCLDKQPVSLAEALALAWRRAVPLILSVVLLIVVLIPATVLFVIPGLYLSVRLFAVQYGVVLENQSPIDAFVMSWELTKGRWWQIFGVLLALVLLVLIPVAILSILLENVAISELLIDLVVVAITPPLLMALLMVYRLLQGQKIDGDTVEA